MADLGLDIRIDKYTLPKSKVPLFVDTSVRLTNERINVLLGLSGHGKTTLLKIILGVNDGSLNGEIVFRLGDGIQDLKHLLSAGQLGYVSQDASLIPWRTVAGNLILPARLNHKLMSPEDGLMRELLETVSIPKDKLAQLPKTLSFGQQRRIALVRTLLYHPEFLLIDELFTGLDSANAKYIFDIINLYHEEHGALCLVVTHDVHNALAFGGNLLRIATDRKGRKQIVEIQGVHDANSIQNLFMEDLTNEELSMDAQSQPRRKRIHRVFFPRHKFWKGSRQ